MHTNSRLLFEKYATDYFNSNTRILEIGADNIPSTYRKIIKGDNIIWDTIDLQEREGFTYVSNSEYSYPIESNTYDIVLSGQVFEHVRKPWRWMKELERFCKVGGVYGIVFRILFKFGYPIECSFDTITIGTKK